MPPPSDRALTAAARVQKQLERAGVPSHMALGREGSILLSVRCERRLAIYECDTEGDVTLLLSDRSSSAAPTAELLTEADLEPSVERARAFVRPGP